MRILEHEAQLFVVNCYIAPILSRDPYILITAFNVYVRPQVEYCSSVWSLIGIGHTKNIESVNRWLTKRIKYVPVV